MARYQRRNAISPTSNEAILLRSFSSNNYSRRQPDLTQTGQNDLSNLSKFVERQLNLDTIFTNAKKLCTAPAA